MRSVRIVRLDPATLHALAAGELPIASPVPLTDRLPASSTVHCGVGAAGGSPSIPPPRPG
ncbi:MAG TPA: hypothetical protein VNC85_11720 [Mycobacteriales bacterium]|nr:hypothetical protein [Mycobacteriales bacterium]